MANKKPTQRDAHKRALMICIKKAYKNGEPIPEPWIKLYDEVYAKIMAEGRQ